MAAASVSHRTNAVAVAVSESSMVRVFDDGELVSEITPELWTLGRYSSYLEGLPATTRREDDEVTVVSRAE
jgi:diadenylate cyclase